TLVESGAKSQSDKRFSTSWKNLIADIEKAAKVAHAHGAKPANLSDEEWAMVLSHRTRSGARTVVKKPVAKAGTTRSVADSKPAAAKPSTTKPAAKKPAAKKTVVKKPVASKVLASKPAAAKAAATKSVASKPVAKKPVAKKPVAKTTTATKGRGGSSVAKRMAKAVSRLSTTPPVAAAAGANGNGALVTVP
ncbi:MAG: hypothetical protein EBX49_12095, partial [Synechococcaceae bacterium WB8_1B_136]|nr:hypothetical protein [Synechococcaceae bacterium WB8_1B_136]